MPVSLCAAFLGFLCGSLCCCVARTGACKTSTDLLVLVALANPPYVFCFYVFGVFMLLAVVGSASTPFFSFSSLFTDVPRLVIVSRLCS